jgi:hypothetical protein
MACQPLWEFRSSFHAAYESHSWAFSWPLTAWPDARADLIQDRAREIEPESLGAARAGFFLAGCAF